MKMRPPRVGGRFQGYANGGRVIAPGQKVKTGNGKFVKPEENPTSAQLEGILRSNRNPLPRERRGPQ